MQVMQVISVVETKSYGITIRPFKIVSKCPCKISFNNGPIVSAKIVKLISRQLLAVCAREREREREREIKLTQWSVEHS
jgi:hypothetical protein